MNILITGVGGPTPRSFAIALKKYSNYKNYNIVGTDANPLAYGLYKNDLFNQSYVIPFSNDPVYWESIEKIINKHGIHYAVVLSENEALEWAKREYDVGLPCKALSPNFKLAQILVDKARMTDLLDPLGVVPRSVEFSREQTDLDSVFQYLGNSFWVRGTSGTSGLGSLKVDSQDSLKNWIEINPNVRDFIASTYLPGRNLACKMLYWKGKLMRSACGERVNYIMAKVAPSGVTGNTSFGRLLNEPELTMLSEKAMNFLFEYTGASKHGFFTVDLKEDKEGKPFITEVNIRHVAFTQCFAAAGANFAEDTMRLLSGDPEFDMNYKYYDFEKDLIFLRDVDEKPIIMKESDLLKRISL